jgi:hypothetical protein
MAVTVSRPGVPDLCSCGAYSYGSCFAFPFRGHFGHCRGALLGCPPLCRRRCDFAELDAWPVTEQGLAARDLHRDHAAAVCHIGTVVARFWLFGA